jgi:putative ABC transport system ATP-binding protein
MAEVVVRVTGLTVRYPSVVALDSVDLDLRAGEILAVVGHSGAGKTTLVSAVSGTVGADAGEVRVAGELVADHPTAVRAGVVVVPEGNALVSVLTALENVLLPLRASGLAPRDAADRARSALASVGLEEFGGHLVDELSGGQQQRVAVARGLASAGRVLLADEPTSELDQENRERVLGLLRARAAEGVAVLMTTHDAEAAAVADAVVALDDGRLVTEGAHAAPGG